MNNYYIYIGKLGGSIVYVGKGLGSRSSHLNSGKSHVYEANENHFKGTEKVSVEKIMEGLSSEEALLLEKDLIIELKPLWNVEHNIDNNKGSKFLRKKQITPKTTSKYLGVCYKKKGRGKAGNTRNWAAFCHCGTGYKEIGMFHNEVAAAVARDKYVTQNGLAKVLNFPDQDLDTVLSNSL